MEIGFDKFKHINIEQLINPIIYIAMAIVFYVVLSKVIGAFFNRNKDRLPARQMRRIVTLKAMTMSIIKYIIVFIVIIAIMAEFGIDVSSLLAGLGIAGVILGLALQDIVKDIFAGFAIITENQYEVGDFIEVGDFKGRVTSVGLKTTRIRDYRGRVKIISNRNISEVINWSRHDTVAEVKLEADYNSDPEKVMKVLEDVKKKLDGSMEEMTGEIKIFAVTELGADGIGYTMQCPCKSCEHYAVQRVMRKEINQAFKDNGIEIPYHQLDVHERK